MKLPEIRPGGVQPLIGTDPSKYIRRGENIARFASTVGGFAADRAKEISEDQSREATVKASSSLTALVKEHSEKQYYTPDELEDLGLNFAGAEGKDQIPAHEVLPELLRKHFDDQISSASADIQFPTARSQWQARMSEIRDNMLEKAYVQSQEKQFEFKVNKNKEDITEALDNGDSVTAMLLAESHPIVEDREAMMQAVRERVENDGYYSLMRSDNVNSMNNAAKMLRSNNYSGELNEKQRMAWVNTLESRIAQINAAASTRLSAEQAREISDLELGIETGETTYADVERVFDKYNSKLNHSWRTKVMKAVRKRDLEYLEDEEGLAKVNDALSGTGIVDPHGDPDDKKYVDMNYDRFLNDVVNAETPGAMNIVIDHGTKLARSTGYVPQSMQAMIRQGANFTLPPEQLTYLAGAYNRIRNDASVSLDFMTDNQKMVMEEIYRMSRAGSVTQDAIKELRQKYETIPGDVIGRRSEEFVREAAKGDNSRYLQNQVDADPNMGGIRMFNVLPWVGGPEIGTQMQQDFDAKTQHYYQISGDMDASREMAYSDIKRVYGVTKVGGKKRLTRDPIEQRYPSIPSEHIQRDLEVFAKDELGLDENQVKGVVLVSDAVTSGTVANPTYSVYWINPDNPADIKLVINDDTGGAIRYSPNVEAIKTRERAREIEAAKEKSDLEYMLRSPSIDLLNRYDGRTEN